MLCKLASIFGEEIFFDAIYTKNKNSIINELVSSILRLDNNLFPKPQNPDRSLESSFIESFWGWSLEFYVHVTGKHPRALSLKLLENELLANNIAVSFTKHLLEFDLTHCKFDFCDNDGIAYGGPYLEGERPKGGSCLFVQRSEIVPFFIAFDNYIPKLQEHFSEIISFAKREAERERLIFREIEALLSPNTQKFENDYFFVSGYNRDNNEITIVAGQHLGCKSLFLSIPYDLFINDPEKFCAECHEALCYPDKFRSHSYIHFEEP